MSDPPPLRLLQRDDALGNGTPRLNVAASAPNQPSSTQQQRAPRIGTANRYS